MAGLAALAVVVYPKRVLLVLLEVRALLFLLLYP
jgi:hypothetical protein